VDVLVLVESSIGALAAWHWRGNLQEISIAAG
jgi:hypothetical protein